MSVAGSAAAMVVATTQLSAHDFDTVDRTTKEGLQAMQKLERDYPRLDNLVDRSGSRDDQYFKVPGVQRAADVLRNHVPVPGDLQRGAVSANSQGIFAEIGRAWAVRDSHLYLWKFNDGANTDFCTWEVPEATMIVSVALVRPKREVWGDLEWLLVVATPFTIRLLGVIFDERDEIQIRPDSMHVCSTDNVAMTSIVGTPAGRIFMAGNDGAVHELYYQRASRWRLFTGSKWRRVNHTSSTLAFLVPAVLKTMLTGPVLDVQQLAFDEHSNILYVRSSDLVTDYYVNPASEPGVALDLLPQSHSAQLRYVLSGRTIAHIAVIPPVSGADVDNNDKSRRPCLVVVASDLTRFYVNRSNRVGYGGAQSMHHGYPGLLEISRTERTPPSGAPNGSTGLSSVFWYENVLLLAGAKELTVVSLDIWYNSKPVTEERVQQQGAFAGAGLSSSRQPVFRENVVQIALPPDTSVQAMAALPRAAAIGDWQNGLLMQHQPPPAFVLLTDKGSYVYELPRPVEKLASALLSGVPGAGMEWFDETRDPATATPHGNKREACAAALVLACVHPQDNVHDLRASALYAIRQAGGRPEHCTVTTPDVRMLLPNRPAVQFSGRHDAAYLCFRRILSEIWEYPLVDSQIRQPGSYPRNIHERDRSHSRLDHAPLEAAELQLDRLGKAMLELDMVKNVPLQKENAWQERDMSTFPVYAHYARAREWTRGSKFVIEQQKNAQYMEDKSLLCLYHTLCNAIEVLRLWGLLLQYDFEAITSAISSNRDRLWTTKFSEICVKDSGRALAKELIQKLLRSRAAPSGATASDREAVNELLHQRCPRLHEPRDVQRQKAEKALDDALAMPVPRRPEDLAACLEQYRRFFGPFSTTEGLQEVCKRFQQLEFWDGIRNLCLDCAGMPMLKNALVHYNGPAHSRLSRAQEAEAERGYALRQTCYLPLADMLTTLETRAKAAASTGGADGAQTQQWENELASQVRKIMDSSDELAHIAVFDWLLSRTGPASGAESRLAGISSPYLIKYLRRRVDEAGHHTMVDKLRAMETLVWRFKWERQYDMAASEYFELSEFPQCDGVDLARRILYISEGITCGESVRPRGGKLQYMLQTLRDRLDCAQEQVKILEQVRARMAAAPATGEPDALGCTLADYQAAEQDLDRRPVQRLTDLWTRYADPYHLPEAKLALMRAANMENGVRPSAQASERITMPRDVWAEVIQQALAAAPGDLADVMHRVLAVAVRFAAPSDDSPFVPLTFILRELERANFARAKAAGEVVRPSYVFERLREEGYAPARLFEGYYAVHSEGAGEVGWQEHLFIVIVSLLEAWSDQRTPTEGVAIRDRVAEIQQVVQRRVANDPLQLRTRYSAVLQNL